jgi:hypothetical protein
MTQRNLTMSDQPTVARKRRGSRRQMAARIDDVARLLARQAPKHEIKRHLRDAGLGARSAERYIALARQHLLDRAGRDRDQWIGEVVGHYESVLRDPNVTPRDRMIALEGLRELLGLDSPRRITSVTAGGDAVPPVVVNVAALGLSEPEKLSLLAASMKLRHSMDEAPLEPARLSAHEPRPSNVVQYPTPSEI